MRTAIIGLGVIGHVHVEVLKGVSDIVAVCDIDKSKFEEFPNCLHFTDYKEMIDTANIDVIHICTPHYLHAEMIIYALERNVNVLCEKPLCMKLDEIDKVLEAEKKSKAKLGVCFQNRFTQMHRFVKNYLEKDPPVSAMANVTWCRDAEYYNQAEWRGTKDQEGGGVLINQAIHSIDLLQWYCGMPTEMLATTSNLRRQDVIEVEDTAFVSCIGKVPFTLYATNGCNVSFPIEMTIMTEKDAIIHITPDYVFIDGERPVIDKDKTYYGKPCYGSGHYELVREFYNAVKNNTEFMVNGVEGSKAIKIVLTAYESNGKTYKL